MNNKIKLTGSMAVALLATILQTAQAQTPITGWGTETGNQNGSPVSTDDGSGNFSLTGATLTGNDAPRALFSTLSLVNVGDNITLSGSFTFTGGFGGIQNDQFRFGLYNTLAANTGTLSGGTWSSATDTGWLGYTVEVGASGGSTQLFQRNTGNSGQWFSGTGQTSMNASSTSANAAAGTYVFSLSLTLASPTSYNIVDSFNQTVGGSYASGNSVTVSDNNFSFNAVGFLLNNNVAGGVTPYTFNNVDVTLTPAAAPEPATLSMIGLGFGGLLVMMRRRKN